MNKNWKTLILILLLILMATLGACTGKKDKIIENSPVEDVNSKTLDEEHQVDPPETEDNNKELSPQMELFLRFLGPDTTTAEIKTYMEDKLLELSQEDLESMLEFLLIYQKQTIDDFMITEDFFDHAYSDLDESIIESIPDEKVRSSYKLLLDSSLKLKFSDYHAYVDTDWKSLQKFSPYLPDLYEDLFSLYTRMESYIYDCSEFDVNSLGEDIIKTETIIAKDLSSFAKKIRNQLYQAQLYNLIIGPEGCHVYFWSDKDNKEYKELMEFTYKYPESRFSKIINEIDQLAEIDVEYFAKPLNKHLVFGLDSDIYIEYVNYREGQGDFDVFLLKIPEDKEKEDSINKILKATIEGYIEKANIDGDFSISTDLIYGDEQYLSYEVIMDYSDSQANRKYMYFYKTLDYIQEKYIGLEEYLATDFELIKDDLENIIGRQLYQAPNFILFSDDIQLYLEDQEGGTYYIGSLNQKDILMLLP